MSRYDNVIYSTQNGKFVRTDYQPRWTDRPNFLIICNYGDWSGFRTLANCEKQLAEIEESVKDDRARGYNGSWFKVVERF